MSLRGLLFLFSLLISKILSASVDDVYVKSYRKFLLEVSGCSVLEKQCSHLDEELALLSCSLNTARKNKTQLSYNCQHKIWTHLAGLFDSEFITYKLKEPCQEESMIKECFNNINGIDCLLKKKPSVKDRTCWTYINKLESLLFNDWQITGKFMNNCMHNIKSYSCGRIPADIKSLSQSDTVKCLQSKDKDLTAECQAQISALRDMKYNSLQLDKVLFAACINEQRNFCSDEIEGSWLMYKCLLKYEYENGVTKRCQDQLFFNRRSIALNYKMSKGLVKTCKEDIKKYRCRKGVVDDKDVRLAQILLCLENVQRNESTKLSPECSAEMTDHRKMLMEDYRLSPELMQNCANDITELCKGIEAGGKTIHCLMEHARPRKRKEKRITIACQKSLEQLVESADPGEDWRVDPILRKACKSVVDRACSEINGGNGRVMSCLMEKLGTALMSPECESALLQIQYFVSRDFVLDPQLYKACKYDAVTQCKAKLQWADINEQQSEKDPLVLPCLYNFAYNIELRGKLKPACEQQVRRVMRQRAISVDLLPEIEDYCIDDLSNICFENSGKGEEIACLQNKIKQLSPKCREAVTNFTEIQSGHIELNSIVNINCRVPIDKLCSAELRSKKEDDDVMECLISHKNDPEIKANVKCRAAIEHEQLISLKNYRFTRKFKNACKSYVVRFCTKAQTKSQVVTCLSEIVRNDTLKRRKHTIFKDCRQQLRSQLFQQKESIDLDPELKEACSNDLNTHCPNIPHGESAALECLQTFKGKLSEACKKAVFIIRKQEFTDNAVDYHLMTSCNEMIDLYCHNTDPSKILDCLKVHRDKPDFNNNCKIVIINRMVEQNLDYRFNNNLQYACKHDIMFFCSDIVANKEQDTEYEGKVLYCLKEQFRKSEISITCQEQLVEVLKEQALNFRLDPLLGKLCKAEIQTICSAPNQSATNSDGQVEECLKYALLNHKIVSAECAREVAQIIEETEIDIDADPLLERACAFDILKYCQDLDHGAGRRLKCLKIIFNDNNRQLKPECHKALSDRLQMYKYVQSVNIIEGLGDIYNEVSSSPYKKYLLFILGMGIGAIFVSGLVFGCIMKRAVHDKLK